MSSLDPQPLIWRINNDNMYCFRNRLSPIAALIGVSLAFPIYATPSASPLMLAKAFPTEQLNTTIYSDDNVINDNFTVIDYLISEKLDGIRAYWNGQQLLTKTGNIIYAPHWFTEHLPTIPLDGELWIDRGHFQTISQIVLDHSPNDKAWQKVKYMAFDLPTQPVPFVQRYQQLQQIITANQALTPHLQFVEHKSIENLAILFQWLDIVNDNHGEGLMLQHKENLYTSGRTNKLLKLKSHDDDEGIVTGYEEGSGKYKGMMGSLWIKTASNSTFKIGTGFSDQQRKSPPAIGSTVQFRFNGYTNNGIPRFARFVRVRNDPDS